MILESEHETLEPSAVRSLIPEAGDEAGAGKQKRRLRSLPETDQEHSVQHFWDSNDTNRGKVSWKCVRSKQEAGNGGSGDQE